MSKYPECEKLDDHHQRVVTIQEFLEWLTEEKGVVLAVQHAHDDGCFAEVDEIARMGDNETSKVTRRVCGFSDFDLVADSRGFHEWIYQHFGIDERKLEAERRAMLDGAMKSNTFRRSLNHHD